MYSLMFESGGNVTGNRRKIADQALSHGPVRNE
jgi:hypothetical protein